VISEIIDHELEELKKSAACEDDDAAGLRSIFLNILELKDLDIRDKKSAIIDFIAAGIETVSVSPRILKRLPFKNNFYFLVSQHLVVCAKFCNWGSWGHAPHSQ